MLTDILFVIHPKWINVFLMTILAYRIIGVLKQGVRGLLGRLEDQAGERSPVAEGVGVRESHGECAGPSSHKGFSISSLPKSRSILSERNRRVGFRSTTPVWTPQSSWLKKSTHAKPAPVLELG